MDINICNNECTELWDHVLYKALSDYPVVADYEMKDIIDFIEYEKRQGRNVTIHSDNKEVLSYVKNALHFKERYLTAKRPVKITECTACPIRKGCMTKFVCHTAPLHNAIQIFNCGSLLSAVNARKLPAEVLMKEPRNAANDPEDFFHYVMFSWGNCQAGDRLVMERKMNRPPTEDDLGKDFTPGIRFYFQYDVLDKHPAAIHDGFLPIKIKDEVILKDYAYAIVVPKQYESIIREVVPASLTSKVYYLENDTKDMWEWSEKVYQFIESLHTF